MKKSVVLTAAGLTLGSALLVTSAFADIGGAKGYETYKSAIKTTAAATNATHNVTLSVTDNGNELLKIGAVVKENEASGMVSGRVNVASAGASESFDFYGREGQHVVKPEDSDTYLVFPDGEKEHEGWGRGGREHNAQWSREGENVIDALVGNLKNNVQVSDAAGGGKTVDVTLSGSQIPTAVNVIGSLIVKHALSGEHGEELAVKEEELGHDLLGIDPAAVLAAFPKLTDDVNIDRVDMKADIDSENYIDGQRMNVTVSGKDATGAAHKVVLTVDVDLENVNGTTPDTIDLAGKKIKTIDEKALEEDNA